MVVFAGPVFPEWYWGPVFFVLLVWPVLFAAAFVLDRLWGRRLRRGGRVWLWVNTVALGTAAIVGVQETREWLELRREVAAAERTIDFAPFDFEAEPGGLKLRSERPIPPVRAAPPYWLAAYREGDRIAFAYQRRATAADDLAPPDCAVGEVAARIAFAGSCTGRRTPSGRAVAFGERGTAFALLDGTLVRLDHQPPLPEAEVVSWVESLRRLPPR